jgi:hypothetical protein
MDLRETKYKNMYKIKWMRLWTNAELLQTQQ